VDVIEFEGGIAHGSVLSDREWYISRPRAIALRASGTRSHIRSGHHFSISNMCNLNPRPWDSHVGDGELENGEVRLETGTVSHVLE
jgi:hypothetical protein